MNPTVSDIEDIIRKWIRDNGLLGTMFETVVSGKTGNIALVLDPHTNIVGIFDKRAGSILLRCTSAAPTLLIDELTYLACNGVTIYKTAASGHDHCLLDHSQRSRVDRFIPCLTCELQRCTFRHVRGVGPSWVLARFTCGLLPEIHSAIGKLLAQIGRG